jgi:hypothetical protein
VPETNAGELFRPRFPRPDDAVFGGRPVSLALLLTYGVGARRAMERSIDQRRGWRWRTASFCDASNRGHGHCRCPPSTSASDLRSVARQRRRRAIIAGAVVASICQAVAALPLRARVPWLCFGKARRERPCRFETSGQVQQCRQLLYFCHTTDSLYNVLSIWLSAE